MGLNSALESLVFFLWLSGIWAEFTDKCVNEEPLFDRIISVPGDVAMLSSTLLSPEVLNLTAVPYNITWYNKPRQEMRNQTGQILVLRETLWFLNTTLEDAGEYVMILHTSFKCYMQSMRLMVDLPVVGECGRPQKQPLEFIKSTSVSLNCPLEDYVIKLESYNITSSIKWFKGCERILDGRDVYAYRDRTILQIYKVGTQNSGSYTCTLTFTLGGVAGSVSETIETTITDVYSFIPRVLEPANETVKAEKGLNFTRKCLVFVPGPTNPSAGLIWFVRNKSIISDPSARIHSPEQRKWHQDKPEKGVYLERLLIISELRAEDININYICRVDSSRGIFRGYFTLLPADQNIIFTIGCIFGGVSLLFIISVTIYNIFKIDIVLWFRRAFSLFYKNKDKKLYDAYVIYSQPDVYGSNEEVEKFALHLLPEVLERACGYKLFIPVRDCLPGQAIVDSVDENIQASHCVLLLYTASTFIDKTTDRNENFSECSDGGGKIEKATNDTRQQLEHVAAMHSALLEGSVKVVLVELEEISRAQLALFPESVRHLKKKQGAVCWWKNLQTRQKWRTCMRRREDEDNHGKDARLFSCVSPSSRFWMEIRFHMPVRGKTVVYPKKTALQSFMCFS